MNESPQPPTPADGDGHPERVTGTATGRRVLLTAAAVLAVLAIALLTAGGLRQEPAPPQADTVPTASGGVSGPPAGPDENQSGNHEGHDASGPPRGAVLSKSAPERIAIPALGVDSTLLDLGLDAEKAMETPDDPDRAGWFTPGPTPGELGPAVIAGHVTWNEEPAVFFELGKAEKGTLIEVGRADGKTAVFTVDRTVRYAKDEFPTVEVYRNLDHAGLRLITCGGEYDETTRRYSDNVVVYASLTSVR